METWQIKAVEQILLIACGKVHLLGKWGQFEVPDPYMQSRQAFEMALKQIEQGVEDWIKKI
jgi:protein-tyrosine phosphatase